MSEAGSSSKGRFKPGKSGNPKGRPKKVVEARTSAFDVVIDRTLTITRNGQPREVSMEEALQHRTYQDAIAGKRMAQREVLNWIRKREAWIAARNATKGTRKIEVKQSPDPMNALDALLILGIATPDDDVAKHGPNDEYRRALLEPWAVQAALDRRRSATPLTERARAEILRCTRDRDALRWPGTDRG
jgi:Family of unknown function (DUF5681)